MQLPATTNSALCRSMGNRSTTPAIKAAEVSFVQQSLRKISVVRCLVVSGCLPSI